MSEMPQPSTPDLGGRPADRAARAVATNADLVPDDYQALRRDLQVHARLGRKRQLSGHDALEIVDEVLARAVRLAADGRIAADTALAYLRRAVNNEAISRVSRRRSTPQDPAEFVEAGADDDIARLISSMASSQMVEALLAETAARGDTTATKVINAYLTLAEILDEDPSYRQVAEECGVTHPTVSAVLSRLHRALDDNGNSQ